MPPSESLSPPASTTRVPGPRPPLAWCIAAIVVSWCGLLAAGFDFQWSAAPPTGDALQYSWLYTNIMLGFLWLVFWPAAALRKTPPRGNWRSDLAFQWLAMLIGALPVLTLAAFFAGAPGGTILATAFAQIGFSLFAAGLVALAKKYPRAEIQSLATFLLVAPATAGPVLYFFLSNFFPRIATAWSIALPPVCIARAAQAASLPALVTAAAYLGIGLLLLAAAFRK